MTVAVSVLKAAEAVQVFVQVELVCTAVLDFLDSVAHRLMITAELFVITVQEPTVLLLPVVAHSHMAEMLIVLADSAVLDFMAVYLTAYVVLYILLKLQLVTLLTTEQLYKLAQKTITNLVTGPDKGTCSIFMLLTQQDVIQRKVFLQKVSAGPVDVVADAMKHKAVFLGIHRDSQEWRQALALR